jgi:hypothetical protein
LKDLPFEIKPHVKYQKAYMKYSHLYDEDLIIKISLEKYGSIENINQLISIKNNIKL